MNYLGHLYFSNNDQELMLHNLYGDFVKGKDLSTYSEAAQKGVKLHRTIDNFIDTNPTIVELGHILQADLPKVYPIAIDLFFDHYLAKNWQHFHTQTLTDFLTNFYASINLESKDYKADFILFTQSLKQHNWISYYPGLFGLYKSCNGLSRRLSFPNELKNVWKIYLKHESLIETYFEKFSEEAKAFFEEYHLRENK